MKPVLFFVILLFSMNSLAQQVKYTILDDEPLNLKKTEIDLSVLGIDFIAPLYDNGEPDVSLNANLRVQHFPIKEKIGIDFNLQLAAALITEVNYGRTNLSASYVIGSKRTKKEHSFVLSQKSSTSGSVRTTTTRYINIPQTRQINFEARAGISRTRGVFTSVPIAGQSRGRFIQYRSHGISAGVQLRRFFYQSVRVNNKLLCEFKYLDFVFRCSSDAFQQLRGKRRANNQPYKRRIKESSKKLRCKDIFGRIDRV